MVKKIPRQRLYQSGSKHVQLLKSPLRVEFQVKSTICVLDVAYWFDTSELEQFPPFYFFYFFFFFVLCLLPVSLKSFRGERASWMRSLNELLDIVNRSAGSGLRRGPIFHSRLKKSQLMCAAAFIISLVLETMRPPISWNVRIQMMLFWWLRGKGVRNDLEGMDYRKLHYIQCFSGDALEANA